MKKISIIAFVAILIVGMWQAPKQTATAQPATKSIATLCGKNEKLAVAMHIEGTNRYAYAGTARDSKKGWINFYDVTWEGTHFQVKYVVFAQLRDWHIKRIYVYNGNGTMIQDWKPNRRMQEEIVNISRDGWVKVVACFGKRAGQNNSGGPWPL